MVCVELPGGLFQDGERHRDCSLKPITGRLERDVAESGSGIQSLPEQVTRILTHAVDRIAGQSISKDRVRQLCSGDRQFLMLQLQSALHPGPRWLTRACRGCREAVQFQLKADQIPVKPAGRQFPKAEVLLSIGKVNIRVPNGGDEEAVASSVRDPEFALKTLVGRLVSVGQESVDADALSREDQLQIDRTLDEMSPRAGQMIAITCPYCEQKQDLSIDHYGWITEPGRGLYQEIHTIALHYHWSENDILSLPSRRRKTYIRLIEQSLGMHPGSKDRQELW